jgi:hypothetical protein
VVVAAAVAACHDLLVHHHRRRHWRQQLPPRRRVDRLAAWPLPPQEQALPGLVPPASPAVEPRALVRPPSPAAGSQPGRVPVRISTRTR